MDLNLPVSSLNMPNVRMHGAELALDLPNEAEVHAVLAEHEGGRQRGDEGVAREDVPLHEEHTSPLHASCARTHSTTQIIFVIQQRRAERAIKAVNRRSSRERRRPIAAALAET